MIHAVVKITLKAAWVKVSLKSRCIPRAQDRIPTSFYQVCTCLKMNLNTQLHSLVCVLTVSTGAGHEVTLCRVQAVGLLLRRHT